MHETMNSNAMRCKAPILILVIAALACAFLGSLTYFVYYDWNYGGYELAFRSPEPLQLFSLLLNTAPYILLFLQVIAFHRTGKTPILIAIALGLMAFSALFYYVYYIIYDYYFTWADFAQQILLDLSLVTVLVLAMISAFKGFSNKVLLIIAVAHGVLLELSNLAGYMESFSWYFEEGMLLYPFTNLMNILGILALYAAIALYGMANGRSAEPKAAEPTPEQALALLKEKLELGTLTEEEYQAQRAEIISKL